MGGGRRDGTLPAKSEALATLLYAHQAGVHRVDGRHLLHDVAGVFELFEKAVHVGKSRTRAFPARTG